MTSNNEVCQTCGGSRELFPHILNVRMPCPSCAKPAVAPAITAEKYPVLVRTWDNDSDEVFNELGQEDTVTPDAPDVGFTREDIARMIEAWVDYSGEHWPANMDSYEAQNLLAADLYVRLATMVRAKQKGANNEVNG